MLESLLLYLVVPGAVMLAIGYVRRRRMAGQWQRLQAEGTAEIPVRLRAGPPPLKGRFRLGHAVSTPTGGLVWAPRFGREAVGLEGLRLVRADMAGGRYMRPGDVVLRGVRADGLAVDLLVNQEWAGLLGELLLGAVRATPGDGAEPRDWRRRLGRVMPLWAAACALIGVLWIGFWGYAAAAGHVVTATVVGVDAEHDACDVEWRERGRVESAEVDCASGAEVGDQVEVMAMPWPFRGEAVDLTYTPWMVGIGAVVMGIPTGIGVWGAWRRRRLQEAIVADGPPPDIEVPVVEPHDVDFDTAAAVMAQRAVLEHWPQAGAVPARRRWWRPSGRRRMTARSAATALLPLLVGVPAVLLGWNWMATTASFWFGETARTDAVVTEMFDTDFFFVPDEAYVRYEALGREYERPVATSRWFDPDDEVLIAYDAEHPNRAKLTSGGDATLRGAAIAFAVTVFAIGLAGWRLRRATRASSEVDQAVSGPTWPARYVMFVGFDGSIGLMLFPAAGPGRPELVVPLAEDVRGRIPVSGTVEVHGRMAPGVMLVPVVDGARLWPLGESFGISAEEAADTLNGGL